jgi:hypothetical protein
VTEEPAGTAHDAAAHDELARTVGSLAATGRPSPSTVNRMSGLAARSAKNAGVGAVASGRWLADVMIDAAGHLPVRDLETLRAHHEGKDGAELATALIRNASIASAGVGAATGALAAGTEVIPATWLTIPIQLLIETMIVVAIELKLVAELHAVAGQALHGLTQGGAVTATAWADSRGIKSTDLLRPGRLDLLGRSARNRLARSLRARLVGRASRNLASFLPLLVGAAAGAVINQRATAKVGNKVAASLGLDAGAAPRG